ncbi:MAG: hypothetical protein KTR30_19335 [Saprospiraceae bacterium]|nr:hypothetical protein [Saprospiraceae bacterium]
MSQLLVYVFCLLTIPLSTLERKAGESAEDFVLRQFVEDQQRAILNLHPIIEYAWGDTQKGKKVLCFVPPKFSPTGMMQAKVFLPQGNQQYKVASIDKILFTGGGGPEQVITVFFEDVDGNGDKELLFIKTGSVKDYQDIEAEDGSVWKNAPYRRRVYDTFIYRQKKDQNGYSPAFEAITWPYLLERLAGLQTASAVRQVIKELKN